MIAVALRLHALALAFSRRGAGQEVHRIGFVTRSAAPRRDFLCGRTQHLQRRPRAPRRHEPPGLQGRVQPEACRRKHQPRCVRCLLFPIANVLVTLCAATGAAIGSRSMPSRSVSLSSSPPHGLRCPLLQQHAILNQNQHASTIRLSYPASFSRCTLLQVLPPLVRVLRRLRLCAHAPARQVGGLLPFVKRRL